MSKSGFSIADLQSAAKKLNTLIDVFDRFGELGADPSKAKKPHHRPKNAREFASKYLEGFYSLVEEGGSVDADAKSHHKTFHNNFQGASIINSQELVKFKEKSRLGNHQSTRRYN
eukprot:gene2966-3234_t